jgi:WD40 repeat protein
VTVTPAKATVYQGATARFQAQVLGEADQSVIWSIEQGIGSIDATGLYTAPRDAYGGPFHVVAASASVPAANGFAVVNVAPIQLTVTPENVTLKPGGSAIFTATVLGLDDSRVTWTIQEAAGGSISDSGAYLAPDATGFFHVVATAVADAGTSGTVTVTVTTSSASFRPTGKLHTGRALHTATLLANGQVLVTGGSALADPLCIGGINSAELYSPGTGAFSPTGSMAILRYAHTATLLPQGAVLVAGGFGSGRDCEDLGEPAQDSAELYDPSTTSFKSTGRMMAGRGGHSATLLPDGRVLLAGGGNQGGGEFPFYGVGTRAAELYDPSRGVFAATGSMAMERLGHTATLLLDGTVLIAGGGPSSTSQPTDSAEVYEPASGAFISTGSLSAPRSGHTATLLPNGKVLIAGGYTAFLDGEFQASASAEIYDPVTRTFSATGNMGLPRYLHTATLLADGTVLVAGGGSATAEVFNPSTGVFVPTGGMEMSRSGHTSTRLKDGKVLTVGSYLDRSFAASAELYW